MNKKITTWITKNINYDLKGKNCFITGANSGLGFEIAKQCANLGANLFLLVRSMTRGNEAKKQIKEIYPDTEITVIHLDLSSISSIRDCALKLEKFDIDCFVNNAGVYHLPLTKTIDGFETVTFTNFLGPLYLTDLLLPHLLKLNHKVDLVFTSSIGARLAKVDLDDFFSLKKYRKFKVYARSKAMVNNMYFNYVDELNGTNINLHIIHPGIVYTPLINKAYSNKSFQKVAKWFMKLNFHTAESASLTLLLALKDDYNSIVGPRGLFEFSGLPHHSHFKRNKNYKKCIEIARKLTLDAVNLGGENE